jgi:hypothetical protein
MKLKAPTPLGEKIKPEEKLETFIRDEEAISRNTQNSTEQIQDEKSFTPRIVERVLAKISSTIEELFPKGPERVHTTKKITPDTEHVSKKNIFSKISKKELTYLLIIGVPTLLFIILTLSISTFIKTRPYHLAEEFLQKIEQGDVESAYQLTTVTYKVVVDENNFESVVRKLNAIDISNAKVKKRKTETVPGMGTYAYVTYRASGYNLEITLFNAKEDWGVHSIELTNL